MVATRGAGSHEAQKSRGVNKQAGTCLGPVKLKDPWLAIGSGRQAAYGALHVLGGLDLDLEEKVRRALAATQECTTNVREPFQLVSVG